MKAETLKQWEANKALYPEYVMLFKMGDFWELFHDDAKVGADVLGLPVSVRDGVPNAGLPYHALDSSLGKLIKAGYRVALCEPIPIEEHNQEIDRQVSRLIDPEPRTAL